MIVGGETGMLLPSGEREKEMQKNVESQTIGFGEIWDFRIVPLPAIIAGRFDRKTVKSESQVSNWIENWICAASIEDKCSLLNSIGIGKSVLLEGLNVFE